MKPHYNFSIDCHENVEIAYQQGVEDMKRKIYIELIKECKSIYELNIITKAINNIKDKI